MNLRFAMLYLYRFAKLYQMCLMYPMKYLTVFRLRMSFPYRLMYLCFRLPLVFDFTSLPSEVTVLVVPSGEVTVEVVLSAVGSGVGAAKENDSGITVINAASSKEINLFLFIIVSLPP